MVPPGVRPRFVSVYPNFIRTGVAWGYRLWLQFFVIGKSLNSDILKRNKPFLVVRKRYIICDFMVPVVPNVYLGRP